MQIRRREFLAGVGITGLSGGKPGAPPPPPVPVAVNLSPSTSTIFNTATSGTSLCSISVVMSDGSTFAGVLTQDGSFTQISGSNLALSRNLVSGDNGSYTIHVTATQNSVGVTSPYMLTVTNPTAPGTAFIGTTAIGTSRADSGDLYRGFRMLVGPNPILVTALGRWVGPLNGSVHTHSLGIFSVNPSNGQGVLMFGSGVTVDISTGTAGTYEYVNLTSNVVLWPGQTYYVCSREPAGGVGDIWYGTDTSVTTTADATMVGGATYDPSNNFLNDTSSGLHPMVPVNFQYTVETYNFAPGTAFTQETGGQWFYSPDTVGVVSGSITVGITIVYSPPANGNGLIEWVVWNGAGALVKRSGPIASTYPPPSGKFAQWVFDTTTLPDGTYVYYPRFLDWSSQQTYQLQADAGTITIANHPPVSTGTQGVPFAAFSNHEIPSARPDFLTYSGTPLPAKTAYSLPYSFVAGSTSPSLRSGSAWYSQSGGPRTYEYQVIPQWATNPAPSGGVIVCYTQSTFENSTPGSYEFVAGLNTFSGTRGNNLVSPFTTYVDDPAGGGVWWGIELGGRLFKRHNDGTVENIVGWERTTGALTFPTLTVSEDLQPRTLVGTFPTGLDLGGGNDLCFDPRNSDIIYVVSQIDHWVAKVQISTKTVTVYAGTPGTSGYSGDGGAATSATFNNPSSIIMSDGTGNGGPAGTMYVADNFNCAIRKITPTGTISTLCGGSLSPGPIPAMTDMGASTTYNVTSMVWSGSSGTVVMAAATNILLGFSITLAGSTTSGANGLYVVSAFTDSQHFSVVVAPASPGGLPSPSNGTFAGTMTFSSFTGDVYSSPGTVNFSGAGAGWFPFPYTIRFTSNNNIVLAEIQGQTARLLDLSANTAVRIGCYDDFYESASAQQWVWIGVNKAGTCGPTDDIIYQKFNDGIGGHGAHISWRLSIDARWIGHTGYSAQFTTDSPSYVPTYAPLNAGIIGSMGHYGWAIHISSTEGRIIGTGTAEWFAAEGWIQTTEPAFDLNQAIYARGEDITASGTVAGFPLEVRPALSSLWGAVGGPGYIIGMSHEDFMHGSYLPTTPGGAGDVALATFIQNGMGGGVPRPELTGNDLRDLIYFIRRGTLQGSVGPTVQQPGPDAADNAPPIFTASAVTRTNATTLHVTWSTDKLTIGLVGAASTTQKSTYNSFTITSDIESAYATTGHAVDLTVPSNTILTPVWVTITAKDQAGNYSHTIPVSIA